MQLFQTSGDSKQYHQAGLQPEGQPGNCVLDIFKTCLVLGTTSCNHFVLPKNISWFRPFHYILTSFKAKKVKGAT